MSVRNLVDPKIMVQLGVAPVRVDLLPRLVTVPFAKAWKRRVRAKFGKTPANFLSLADLMAEKRHFARAQDVADLEQLERAARQRPTARRPPSEKRGTRSRKR